MSALILGSFIHPPKHKGAKPIPGGLRSAKAFSEASYKEPKHRPETLGSFQLDRDLSNKRNAVYHDPASGRVVVAFRGTDFSDMYDIEQDVRIATGTFAGASRIKKGKDITKAAAEKYGVPAEAVELTGHSLGGRIAQAVGEKLGATHVTAINPGSSPVDLLHDSAGSGYGRTFTTGVDPVSVSNTLANPLNARFRVQSQWEPHGLGAFNVPEMT
jgi:hypothetical protein